MTTHYDHPPYGYIDWWPIGLGFDTEIKPFDDPDIRWAISYAVDRDEIVDFAFSGYSQTAALPFPPYPGLQKYMDAVADQLQQYPTLKFDTGQSDAIMTRKGYTKNGDGLWADSSGKTVAFQIVTSPSIRRRRPWRRSSPSSSSGLASTSASCCRPTLSAASPPVTP